MRVVKASPTQAARSRSRILQRKPLVVVYDNHLALYAIK